MTRRVLASLAFCAAVLAGQSSFWPTPLKDWQVRRALSNLSPVGNGVVLTNFPLFLSLSNDDVLRQSISTNGDAITFTGDDGLQLFQETLSFQKSTGQIAAFVCIPYFSNQTRIWLYASNTNAGGAFFWASNAGYGYSNAGLLASLRDVNLATNVWDTNYLIVYHFTNRAGVPTDSTGYRNHITSNYNTFSSGYDGPLGPSSAWYCRQGDWTNSKLMMASNAILSNIIAANTLSVTHSVWMKFDGNPAQYAQNAPGVSDPLYRTSHSYLFALSANGTPDDGNGAMGIVSVHNSNGGAMAAGFGGFSMNPVPSRPNAAAPAVNNWAYIALAAGTNGTPWNPNGDTRLVMNDQTVVLSNRTSSFTGGSTGQMGYMGTLYLMGGTGGSGRFQTVGWISEYRLSAITRSSNWLATEYSNVAQANAGTLAAAGDIQIQLSGVVKNSTSTYPRLGANQTTTNFLDPASLLVPNAPANFITNITWSAVNNNTLSSLSFVSNYSSNLFFGATGATNYLWPLQYPDNGRWSVTATLLDGAGNAAVVTNVFFVYQNGYVNTPTNAQILRTNQGVILDLFPGVTNNAGFSLTLLRNGASLAPVALTPTRWLDSNNLFYGTAYTWQATLRYVESGERYTVTLASNFQEPSNLILVVQPSSPVTEARTFRTFDTAIVFPSNADGTWNVSWSIPSTNFTTTSRDRGSAFRQRTFAVVEKGAGAGFGAAARLTVSLPLSATGVLTVPGYAGSNLTWMDVSRLSLAIWDGDAWAPLPTSMSLYANRVALSAPVSHGMTTGILLGTGAASVNLGNVRLNTRFLVPGSSDASKNAILFSFDNPFNQTVQFQIMDVYGHLAAERTLDGSFVTWDGTTLAGVPAAPGLYLWALRVGGKDAATYRGSLIVGGSR